MSAPPQLIVPALWMGGAPRKRVPVPWMWSCPPAGMVTRPLPRNVESPDQLIAPVAVVARSPEPVTVPPLKVMACTVRLPPTESVPALTESAPFPRDVELVMAVAAPPGAERGPQEVSWAAPAMVALLKTMVPGWMSTTPAAGLVNDWLICVV